MTKILNIFLIWCAYYCSFNSFVDGVQTHQLLSMLKLSSEGTDGDSSEDSACVCGVSGIKRKNRILMGDVTHFIEFPWLARIYYYNDYYCVGTLVTRRHVLSAAHCLRFEDKYYMVHLNDKKDYKAKSIKVHENFRGDSKHYYKYNIAILEMKKAVTLSDKVSTGCLPDANDNFEKEMSFIAGWGPTGKYESYSKSLRKLKVEIKPESFCSSDYLQYPVGKDMLCAGNAKGRYGPCYGDDGGPVMVLRDERYYVVAAVISEVLECGMAGYPTVGTKLNQFTEWILKNIGNATLCSPPT